MHLKREWSIKAFLRILWQLSVCCEMLAGIGERIRDALVIKTVDKELSLRSTVQSDIRGNYYYNLWQFINKQDTEPEWTWEWICLLAVQKERKKKYCYIKKIEITAQCCCIKKPNVLLSTQQKRGKFQCTKEHKSMKLFFVSQNIEGKRHFKVLNYMWRIVWGYSSMPDYKIPTLKWWCCSLHLTSLDLW